MSSLHSLDEQHTPQFAQLLEGIQVGCWSRGQYSFMQLQLNILDNSWEDFIERGNESEALPTLVHEYVHYMQQFTTVWGFTNFFTYLGALLQSFLNRPAASAKLQVPLKLNLPLNQPNTPQNYLASAWRGLNRQPDGRFTFAASSSPPFSIEQEACFDPYFNTNKSMHWVTVNGCRVPLTPIVLAENMALAASFLTARLPLAEVDHHMQSPNWQLHYTAVYRTLREALPAADCLRLTYELTETALLIPPYSTPMAVMLRFVQDNRASLAGLSETAIITRCQKAIRFSVCYPAAVQNSLQKIGQQLALYQQHAQQYSLFPIVRVILDNLRAGLVYRQTHRSTYASSFGLNFIMRLTRVINSPIIIFRGDVCRAFGTPDAAFTEALAQYNGLLTLHNALYNQRPTACPLVEPTSVCSHQRERECRENALAAPNNPRLKHCLLYNTLLLAGVIAEEEPPTA